MIAELREEYPRANCARHGFIPALVREMCSVSKQAASSGTPARPAGDSVPAARLAELQRIRAEGHAHTRKSRGLSVNQRRYEPLRELAPRTRCPLWCRAIGSFAKTESWPAIAGDFAQGTIVARGARH